MYAPWIDNASRFVHDVAAEIGPRPDGYTLDRINNDGNYEPGNIQWATRKEQGNNTSINFHITYKGETRTLSEWSAIVGISGETLGWRFEHGMPLDEVFDKTDKRSKRRDAPLYEYEGKSMPLKEWAKTYGLNKITLNGRLNAGWTFGEAISASPHRGKRPTTRIRRTS